MHVIYCWTLVVFSSRTKCFNARVSCCIRHTILCDILCVFVCICQGTKQKIDRLFFIEFSLLRHCFSLCTRDFEAHFKFGRFPFQYRKRNFPLVLLLLFVFNPFCCYWASGANQYHRYNVTINEINNKRESNSVGIECVFFTGRIKAFEQAHMRNVTQLI